MNAEEKLSAVLKGLIRTIPDHPKPGILFRDITTLLLKPQGLRAAIDGLTLPFVNMPIDLIAGDRGARFHSRRRGCARTRQGLRAGAQKGKTAAQDHRTGIST